MFFESRRENRHLVEYDSSEKADNFGLKIKTRFGNKSQMEAYNASLEICWPNLKFECIDTETHKI